jgi:hypothetical protein
VNYLELRNASPELFPKMRGTALEMFPSGFPPRWGRDSEEADDDDAGSYTISFVAPAVGVRLRAKGALVRAGKRQVVASGQVWSETDDAPGKLVAVAQATMIVV